MDLDWAPELTGTHMGHDWVDLGLRNEGNKILLATTNIGATNPEDYGDYFAWGETSKRYTSIGNNGITPDYIFDGSFDYGNAPYHTGNSNTAGWTKYIPTSKSSYWSGVGDPDNKTVLDLSDDVANVQWGGDWRMPTAPELCMLLNGDGESLDADFWDNVTYAWTSNYNSTGRAGLVITGKYEYNSISLFLPAAGELGGNSRGGAGSEGYYWSSSLNSSPYNAYIVYFENGEQVYGVSSRHKGLPIRPVLVISE